MTTKEIYQYKSRIDKLIDSRRLSDAIKELKDMAHRRMAWEVTDKLQQTEQAYAYMLKYVVDGVNDPERDSVYDSIVSDLYAILDALVYYMNQIENTSQYFSTVRLFQQRPQPDRIEKLISAYVQKESSLSFFNMVEGTSSEQEALSNRKQLEQLQSDLFVSIWIKNPLSIDDKKALTEVLGSNTFDRDLKIHLISAIMLGLLQNFDSKRFEILIETYMSENDVRVTSAALVGFLLGLWLYRTRPLPKKLSDLILLAKDRRNWTSDLRIAFLEFIRARDTERINKKIRDEIVPDMMKLRPEILNKVNDGEIDPNDMASLQENPEWQELMDKNGITEKLKELTEMQMEGGDIMMSTFSHLKNFEFFNDISNWFLPFSSSHTKVSKSISQIGIMADMVENAAFLCDNDKYSFMFALDMVPQDQRKLMVSQFQAHSDSIYEAMGQMQTSPTPDMRRKAANAYMQNIYRFFKLYRRKSEFWDPFNTGVNLIAVPALASDFDDIELLQVVSEFYFKLGYYKEALNVYQRMSEIFPLDEQQYQKMGYCYEKLKDYDNAIDCYKKAELLDAKSVWPVRRLAACYRVVGNKDMAMKYYQRLVQIDPNNLSDALLLGYVLLEKEDYEEAVRQFYMVEFLDEKSTKSWRPLAWTLFLTGDFEGSKRYYEKIINDRPNATDYLNMGHVALATHDMKEAVNSYELYIQNTPNGKEAFLQSISDDKDALKKAGVSVTDLPLVIDAVLYMLDK